MPTKNELEAQVAELEARLAQAESERRAEAERAQLAAAAVQKLEAQHARRPSLDVSGQKAEPAAEEPRVWVEMTPHNPHHGRKCRRYSIEGVTFDSASQNPADRCALLPISTVNRLIKQRDERQKGTAAGAVLFVKHDKRPY